MIRVDALELVTVRQRHLFREEELNSLASEGDRLLALLPTLPKNVPYRLIAALLQENVFSLCP